MEITEEDREAFHSQADRIANAVDVKEVGREDNDGSVTSVFMALDENESATMVTVKVLPRHRFLVQSPDGRTRTTRRDEAIEAVQNVFA